MGWTPLSKNVPRCPSFFIWPQIVENLMEVGWGTGTENQGLAGPEGPAQLSNTAGLKQHGPAAIRMHFQMLIINGHVNLS